MATNIKCPECKGSKVWLKGSVPTRKGPKKRYICYTCGKSFYAPSGSKPRNKKAKS